MFGENFIEFFKDLGSILKKVFSSRIVPFMVVALALFSVLIIRLFNLQIVNGENYTNTYAMKAEKTVSTTGTRGNIYDRNGKLLAYSELAYSVVISDCGYYESNKIRYAALNNIIGRMISIIESNGDTIDYSFGIDYNPAHGYYYTVSDNSLLRFLRDVYGHAAISDLTEEERTATAEETAAYLRKLYKIYTKEDYEAELKAKEESGTASGSTESTEPEIFDDATAMKISYIRYNLNANSYKRYISFTVASGVNSHTMASILENSDVLTGVSIEEGTVRKYNYSTYLAHILGYTGKVSEEQLEELQKEDESYSSTDIVGKAGIEQEFETTLSGTKGEISMLVDSVGRVTEITNEVEATAGDDVYLTIDAELQEKIYNLMERVLAETLVTYLTPSDNAYSNEEHILVPIIDVYFALINNNLIDMDKIASSDTEAAVATYAAFSSRKEILLTALDAEMMSGTTYNMLDAEMQSCIKLIRRELIDNEILNKDKISSSDPLQKSWNEGSISFRDYLLGAISNEWINIYNLDVTSEYPTTEEVLNAVINEAVAEIYDCDDFNKLIYEYLIDNHIISGRNICLILMEQGAIEYSESEYVNIYNGGSTFDFLKNKILSLAITPAQLALDPCSGSCVMEDPNTGQIIAMVSYPSYDVNYFSGTIDPDYYKQLLNDKSTPLVNRATQTKIAPGSTFKPLISIAGMNENVVSAYSQIECDGIYDKITPNIKCHVYPNAHGYVDAEAALEHSCNEYFCEIGYRLCVNANGVVDFEYGLKRIQKYTELLGLSTKTGIQLPETTPHASDYNAVASSIGQGTNAYTSLNLARYISTVANNGTVYNSSIVSKIVSSDNSTVDIVEPSVSNTVDIDSSIWNTVHNGMRRVITEGVMDQLTKTLPVTVYGKSGTAQEDKKRADHACYVMFSTDQNNQAEIVTTVMIPYGHAATHAGIMAYYAMAAYYDSEIPSSVFWTTNYVMDVQYND